MNENFKQYENENINQGINQDMNPNSNQYQSISQYQDINQMPSMNQNINQYPNSYQGMNVQEFDLEKENEATSQHSPNTETINCPRCGKSMPKSARCCMHCGELNPLNIDNKNVSSYFSTGKKIREKNEKKGKRAKISSLYGNGVSKKEKFYSFRNHIKTIILLIFIVLVVINYKNIYYAIDNFRKDQYLKQVDKIVEQVKEKYSKKVCSTNFADGKFYYVFYSSNDGLKTFLSLYTFEYFSGYVEIIYNNDGTEDYIVTITDGLMGFKNVKYQSNLDRSIVTKIDPLEMPSGSITCQ